MDNPTPTIFRYIRSKNAPYLWEVAWHFDDRPMTAQLHPIDRAYIEQNYDIEVDPHSRAETYEVLILSPKPARAPENPPTP